MRSPPTNNKRFSHLLVCKFARLRFTFVPNHPGRSALAVILIVPHLFLAGTHNQQSRLMLYSPLHQRLHMRRGGRAKTAQFVTALQHGDHTPVRILIGDGHGRARKVDEIGIGEGEVA